MVMQSLQPHASIEGKDVILKGWKSAGITEAIQKGLNIMLDPYNDIDPMINFNNVDPNLEAINDKTNEELESLGVHLNADDIDTDNDEDDEEVYEIDRNAFDICDDGFVDESDEI